MTKQIGFTLAELLISLAILGVIATFTIPKILQSQQNGKFNAIAKEAAGTMTGAYQAYQLNNQVTSSFSIDNLTPLINYVGVTTLKIDNVQTNSSIQCGSFGFTCLRLHNGAVLLYSASETFGGTASTNATEFFIDPDGKVTDGTTNGAGHSIDFWLYANGRIRTSATVETGTTNTSTGPVTPDATLDPPWFSW